LWGLPPDNDPAGRERHCHQRHDCSGVVLVMDEFLLSLAELFHLPLRGGFTELDKQIKKLRTLRDSYQGTTVAAHTDQCSE